MGTVPADPPDDDLPEDGSVDDEAPGGWPGAGVPLAGIPTVGGRTIGLPLTGRALLATPTIGDDRFARSVILLLEHDDTGALGVVLNAPGEAPVDLALPEWAGRVPSPAVVFTGGPVGTDRALGLIRLGPAWERRSGTGIGLGAGADGGPDGTSSGAVPEVPVEGPAGVIEVPGTAGTIGLVDLSRSPEELDGVPGAHEVRVFAGYAGWGAGQLDAELEVGAWWDATVGGDDVFTARPESLWSRVVARQDGARALFARCIGDPSLN